MDIEKKVKLSKLSLLKVAQMWVFKLQIFNRFLYAQMDANHGMMSDATDTRIKKGIREKNLAWDQKYQAVTGKENIHLYQICSL